MLEHPDFTIKPFIENDYDNWWSLKYTMTKDEMNKINDKTEDLEVLIAPQHKFNGCGLVISSDIIKSGVNVPRAIMLAHEDTAFQNSLIRMFGTSIPQFVIKNVLLVHNRKHPKKREYVLGEDVTRQIQELKENQMNGLKRYGKLIINRRGKDLNKEKFILGMIFSKNNLF